MRQRRDSVQAGIVQPTGAAVWAPLVAGAFIILVLTSVAAMIVLSLIPLYLPKRGTNIVRSQPVVTTVSTASPSASTSASASASTLKTFSAVYPLQFIDTAPDGVERPVLHINGQYPGPIITVNKGDVVNVTFINLFNQSATIHWHGMLQRGTVQMDGVPGVTQCSILPNASYTYTFSTKDQTPGTYWYHSHSGIQLGDGLQGALVINDPSDPWKNDYASEVVIFLTEWNHVPFYELLEVFLSAHMLEPIPDSALINGIGQYNCTTDCSYFRTFIQPGTTKRFRLINSSLYSKITFSIDQHILRIIEVDGIAVDGTVYTKTCRLNPGQRYSVLVTALENPAPSYWIRSTLSAYDQAIGLYLDATQPNASAILQYDADINSTAAVIVPAMDTFNNDQDVIYQSFLDGEEFADEKNMVTMQNDPEHTFPTNRTGLFVYNLTVVPHLNTIAFAFNGALFTHPATQTLLAAVLTDNLTNLNEASTMKIQVGQVYDLCFNNQNFAAHPMHLHGHDSWVIGVGPANAGYTDGTVFPDNIYNTTHPFVRDTITVNPFSYLCFRFIANNPGTWIMHCHNDWHVNLGMALVFVEGIPNLQALYANQTSASIPATCPAGGE